MTVTSYKIVAVAAMILSMACSFLLGWRLSRVRRNGGSAASANPTTGELYVGNLSDDTTEEHLREAFSAYGKVSSIRLINNRLNGRQRHFAFISLGGPDEARAAIRAMHNREFRGSKLVVNEAKSRQRRGGHGR